MSRITNSQNRNSTGTVSRSKRSLILAAAVAGIGLFMGRGHAASTYQAPEQWTGNAGNNNWNAATNWASNQAPPTNGDPFFASFNSDAGAADYTVNINTPSAYASLLTFTGGKVVAGEDNLVWAVTGAAGTKLDLRDHTQGFGSLYPPVVEVGAGTTVILSANYSANSVDPSATYAGGFVKSGLGELRLLGTGNTAGGIGPDAPAGTIFLANGTLSFNSLAALGTADILMGQDPGFSIGGSGYITRGPATVTYLGTESLSMNRIKVLPQNGDSKIVVAEESATLTLTSALSSVDFTSGQRGLIKSGPGTLELKPQSAAGTPVANSFVGNILVEEGMLKIHALHALGAGRNRVTLANMATLQVNDAYVSNADPTLVPTAWDPGANDNADSKYREIGRASCRERVC